MTPILFERTETAFTSNGIGRLADATKCEATEERNGIYELVMEYPVGGKMATELQVGRYIFATHDESKVPQAFQIYEVSNPLEGTITINAWHISYALNGIIVNPFTAGSCADALAAIPNNIVSSSPFTFWTDKSVTGNFSLTEPAPVRGVLGGTEGSILDTYGTGEYEFDMYNVKLYLHRGTNRGVSIRYGKNLTKLDQTLDASNVFNAVAPYWTGETGTVYLDHLVVRTGQTAGRAIVLDLSDQFENEPTAAQLEAAAQSYVDASPNYEVHENIKIDFVALWQTEEYKNFAALERIYLCDTVNIFYERLGINATAKCIKVVYDTLRERYVSMELGEPRTTLVQEISEQVVGSVLEDVPSKGMMQSAIDRATELITGGYGGYIKYTYLSDGTPSEILVMDSADASTAVHVIRINQSGIGFSSTGINGPYTSAWTIDGAFNADFITAGALNANLITAGILQDANGYNVWNLETGEFTLSGYATHSEAQSYAEAEVNDYENAVREYMNYNGSTGVLTLGDTGSQFKAMLENTRLAFTGADGSVVAWISNNQLYINEAVINTDLQLPGSSGKWLQQVRNDHFQIRWVGN